jgi:hypothetical protein
VDIPTETWAFDLAATLSSDTRSFAAPATRDFAVVVTVTDAHGSSTTCRLPTGTVSDGGTSSNGTSTSISTSNTSSRDVGGSVGVAVVECPLGIGPEGVFDAATVAEQVAELIATDGLSPDVASAAFLAGLDAYTASAAALVLGSGSTTLNISELDHTLELLLEAFLLYLEEDDVVNSNSNASTARFSSQDVTILASAVDAGTAAAVTLGDGSGGDTETTNTTTLLLDIIQP